MKPRQQQDKPKKPTRREQIVELARAKHQNAGMVEIDDNAKISEGDDNGAYVQAWVWVNFAHTPFDKEASR